MSVPVRNWTDLLAPPVRRRALVIASQVALTAFGYLTAFAIVFDFSIPAAAQGPMLTTLPWLLALRLALAHRFRLDRSYWRHIGFRDLVDLIAATTLGSLLFPLLLVALGRLDGIPALVLVLDWLLAITLTGGVRVVPRWVQERTGFGSVPATTGRRTFIVGAGEAGEQLLRQLLHDRRQQYQVVGLVDDDPAKLGHALHGVPILGSSDELRRLVAIHQPNLALIAIPSATPEQLRRLVDRCTEAGTDVKILPPLQDLITGDVHVSHIRDVQIEDLLGREPVALDAAVAEPDIAGKVVLITGAGGSIGSELARQIAHFNPVQLVLLERAESPLYYIHLEIARANPAINVVPVLASVTNAARLEQVFATYRPDCVFHAAAYKHVPMLEANILEGVWNNVIGTLRLARCAVRAGSRKFVLISTDKAVNPTSILGATKRIGERIVLELPSLRAAVTDFRVVRFGNVLGSDGSVVPLFKRQLAAGGPLTVTHPEVRRYFMTIPEAVNLVLQAAALPEAAGRIALLEMGRQVRVLDLAEQLIRLAGLVPHTDVKIEFTGLRPGEKLEEELVASEETALPTTLDKIRIVERNGVHGAELAERLRSLIRVTTRGDRLSLLRAIAALVPDYLPPSRDLAALPDGLASLRPLTNGHGNGNGNGHRETRRPLLLDDDEAVRRNGTNDRA